MTNEVLTDRAPTGAAEQQDDEDARRERPRVTVVPKVVVSDDGNLTLQVRLVHRRGPSVSVELRVSLRGRLIDVDAPTIVLEAGRGPVDLNLSLPVGRGIRRGAKLGVEVVSADGTVVGASSTGLVTFRTPSGRSVAFGPTSVTATVGTVGVVTVLATGALAGSDPEVAHLPPPPPTEVEIVVPAALVLDASRLTLSEDGQVRLEVVVPELPHAHVAFTSVRAGAHRIDVVVDGSSVATREVVVPATLPLPPTDAAWSTDIGDTVGEGVADRLVGAVCRHDSSDEVAAIYAPLGAAAVSVGISTVPTDVGYRFAATAQLSVEVERRTVAGIATDDVDWSRCPERAVWTATWSTELVRRAADADADEDAAVDVIDDASESDPSPDDAIDADDVIDDPSESDPSPDDTVGTDDAIDADDAVDDASESDGSPDDAIDADEVTGDDDGVPPAGPDTADGQGPVEYVDEPATGALRLGDVGRRVSALQRGLRAAGYEVDLDGIFGPATLDAILDFQAREGLEVDGLAGPATHSALGLPYADLE